MKFFKLKLEEMALFFFLLFCLIGCGNELLNEKFAQLDPSAGSVLEEEGLLPGDLPVSLNIPQPNGVRASKGEFADKIVISWNQVVHNGLPVTYHVYRRETADFPFIRITGYTPISTSTFSDFIPRGEGVSKSYQYAVRTLSVVDGVTSKYSLIIDGFILDKSKLITATFRQSNESIKIEWEAVPGAKFYILRRAEEKLEGVIPAESSFEIVNSAIVDTFIYDSGVAFGGTLIPNVSYYYYVIAHYDSQVAGEQSNFTKGALLALGAPTAPVVKNITRGVFNNAIRIEWESDPSLEYTLFRFTQADFDSGDEIGTPIEMSPDFISGTNIFYDTDISVASGETFYYRLSATNGFGGGPLSDFNRRTSAGSGIAPYANTPIDVKVLQTGFDVAWPICSGAPGYYIYRSTVDPATAGDDSAWIYIDAVSANLDNIDEFMTYTDPAATLSGIGVNIERDKVWYRVLPLNMDLYSKDNAGDRAIFTGVAQVISEQTITATELKDEFDALTGVQAGFAIEWGHSDFSASVMDYTVPIPIFDIAPLASQNGKNVSGAPRGTIRLTGKLSDGSGLDKLAIKLIRTCHYGKEDGVHPFREPNINGGITYSKHGQADIVNKVEYDITSSFNSEGAFVWDDPMPAFDEKGKIEVGKAHRWNYAAWDREAWKDVKRKHRFNMDRAVKVKYEVRIERANDPTWGATTTAGFEGWPELTNLEFAHLAAWLREVAFNRLWKVQIPRWNWDNTFSVLIGGVNQSANGQNGGSIGLTGSTSSGSGSMKAYSDWPGFVVHSKDNTGVDKPMTLAIDIGSMQDPQTIDVWITIETPLYNGTMHGINCQVRDFGWQWGIWPEGSKVSDCGTVEIWYNGHNYKFGKATEVFPSGNVSMDGGDQVIYGVVFDSPYGYEEFDYRGSGMAESSIAPYTRFSYMYRPQPENNGPWSDNAGSDWVMNYEYVN